MEVGERKTTSNRGMLMEKGAELPPYSFWQKDVGNR